MWASLVPSLKGMALAEIGRDKLGKIPLRDELHEELTSHLLPLVLLLHPTHQLLHQRARHLLTALLQLRAVPTVRHR